MFDLGDVGDFLFGSGGSADEAHKQYNLGIDTLKGTNVETGPSAYETTDPGTRAAQMEALSSLQHKYTSGGLDAIDRARMGDINDQQTQAAATQRAAVAQDAARRGMWNSGNQLVAAQLGGQQAVTQGNQQARSAAALAEGSRLAEIGQAGGLAGDVRGQDYQKASAQDAIARFNAAQRLGKSRSVAGAYGDLAHSYEGDAARRQKEMGGVYSAVGSFMPKTGSSGAGAGGTSPEDEYAGSLGAF